MADFHSDCFCLNYGCVRAEAGRSVICFLSWFLITVPFLPSRGLLQVCEIPFDLFMMFLNILLYIVFLVFALHT